jgi:sugar/nucleoside kinase (ribokinase family)
MNPHLHFDYTAVGHVTVDVLADGSRRPGGTAFYSAIQAARLGCRTLILTQGVTAEIEDLLAPHRDEIDLVVHPAAATTTLLTLGSGAARRQRMLAWAGPMADSVAVDTAVLHLAPVARECPARWHGPSAFVGLTPQGLVREWSASDDEVTVAASADARAVQIARRCHAIVVSEHEHDSCRALIAGAASAGAVTVITAGAAPATILLADGRTLELDVPAVEDAGDDLGAGDVFAAAFFTMLADGAAAERAAGFANAAAAVRMGGTGAEAIGDRRAMDARLDALAAVAGRAGPASPSGA